MTIAQDIKKVARFLANALSSDKSRQSMMASVFTMRYGCSGHEMTSLASIGAMHGFSASTAQYHLRRMLSRRGCVKIDLLPSVQRAKELILSGAKDLPQKLTGGIVMEDLLRFGHDLFDPLPEVSPAGAKPRASQLRMTAAQFDCLIDLAGFRGGPAVLATRRVMVDGLSMAQAAREAGLTQQRVNNVRARVAHLYDLVADAYGIKGSAS